MWNVIKIYRRITTKYPVIIQATQTGALMGFGDIIAQNIPERKTLRDFNFLRTAQFASIGFFITGPTVRTWYGILNKYIGSKGGVVVIKKVACDQLLFAPIFIVVLISIIGLTQGLGLEDLRIKLREEYPEILKNNYKVWPLVQLFNFYFIPLKYQVLLVQVVALLWNAYISYRTSSGKEG